MRTFILKHVDEVVVTEDELVIKDTSADRQFKVRLDNDSTLLFLTAFGQLVQTQRRDVEAMTKAIQGQR